MTVCNPWTTTVSPSNLWRVQSVTQRRITEEVALRRTEQGDIRIVQRGGVDLWSPAAAPPADLWSVQGGDGPPLWMTTDPGTPASFWNVHGWNYRLLEDGCLRHTEDSQIRLVENEEGA